MSGQSLARFCEITVYRNGEQIVAGNSVGLVVVFMFSVFGLRFSGFGESHLPPLSSCTWSFGFKNAHQCV